MMVQAVLRKNTPREAEFEEHAEIEIMTPIRVVDNTLIRERLFIRHGDQIIDLPLDKVAQFIQENEPTTPREEPYHEPHPTIH